MVPKRVAVEVKQNSSSIEDVAFAGNTRPEFVDGLEKPPLQLTEVSYNLLPLLGVSPIRGLGFDESAAQSRERLVLLREETWRSRYGGSPDLIGSFLGTGDTRVQIVGILPEGLIFPTINWATRAEGMLLSPRTFRTAQPNEGVPGFVARLRPGYSVATAQLELDRIREAAGNSVESTTTQRVSSLREGIFWNVSQPLRLLFIGSLLLWLITTTNLSVMALARARTHENQTAIRISLGAGSYDVVRSAAAEIVILCGAGAAVAGFILFLGIHLLPVVVPHYIQPLIVTSLDGRLLAFLLLSTSLGALVASVWPAYLATRTDPALTLQRAGRPVKPRRPFAGNGLIFAETAVATILVLAGTLAVKSLLGLLTTDLGFRPDALYTVGIRSTTSPSSLAGIAPDSVVGALRASPGVIGVAAVDVGLGGGESVASTKTPEGRVFKKRRIDDAFLTVIEGTLLAGRSFTSAETKSGAPVVILNEAAAKAAHPGLAFESVIGSIMTLPGDVAREVLGVVKNILERRDVDAAPEVFLPMGTAGVTSYMVRATTGGPLRVPDIESQLRALIGPGTVVNVVSVSSRLDTWLQSPRLYANLFGSFAAASLILAVVGLFAIVSADVVKRRHEMGVRMALGAKRRDVLMILIKRVALPVAAGVVVGWIGAYWSGSLLQTLLHGISAHDPVMYVFVALVFCAATAVAVWWPARVASAVDPLSVIRESR